MLTSATSLHGGVYPRRKGLIFLSYIASLEPELHDNVSCSIVFFWSGCSRSVFFPRRPIDFLTLKKKKVFSLDQVMVWFVLFSIATYCLKAFIHFFFFVGSCQQIRRNCLFFYMRPWAWVVVVILVISILIIPCDKIFIKVPPTKWHDHIKNIFEIGLSFHFQLIFRTGTTIMYKIYQVS